MVFVWDSLLSLTCFLIFNEENRECTMAQSISSDFYSCIFLLILFHVDWRLQKVP